MRTELQSPKAEIKTNQLLKLCTFQVAGRMFGVDILDVKEINAENDYTPVFHAPHEVQGYVNIRGQIHLVLDLRALLGLQAQDDAAQGRRQLVLFKHTVGESFAVQVDAIGDIVSVDEAHYEPGQSGGAEVADGIEAGLMLGVCRLEKGLLVVLDAHRFLLVLS